MDPSFFIVGAPKCGTTAVHRWLGAHPELFASPVKEPHFFGSDLHGHGFIRDLATYRALFAGATGALRAGESSVFYLYSRHAAAEIHAFAPDARIIVMLRDPVAMIESLHAELYVGGAEDIADPAVALAAEEGRCRSRRLQTGMYPPEIRWYRSVADYPTQLWRYLDVFGPSQVHVMLLDELATDRHLALRRLLGFLGVDQDILPELRPANERRHVRSHRLHRWLLNPPTFQRRAVATLLPARLRRRMVDTIAGLNTGSGAVSRLDTEQRAALRTELAPRVKALEATIGRDLSHWITPEAARSESRP